MTMPVRSFPAAFLRQAALALSLAMLATPAWAYLDPSTGSMILSAIIGIFATVGLAVKTYWYRLKNLVRGRRQTSTQDGKESGQSDADADRPARKSTAD